MAAKRRVRGRFWFCRLTVKQSLFLMRISCCCTGMWGAKVEDQEQTEAVCKVSELKLMSDS